MDSDERHSFNPHERYDKALDTLYIPNGSWSSMADFKVIIKKRTGDNDENTYYGSVFIPPNHIQSKQLGEFDQADSTVHAAFSFPQNTIRAGEKFAACYYAVFEGEDLDEAACKTQENSPAPRPEVVLFD
jgi:hypothetical protein